MRQEGTLDGRWGEHLQRYDPSAFIPVVRVRE